MESHICQTSGRFGVHGTLSVLPGLKAENWRPSFHGLKPVASTAVPLARDFCFRETSLSHRDRRVSRGEGEWNPTSANFRQIWAPGTRGEWNPTSANFGQIWGARHPGMSGISHLPTSGQIWGARYPQRVAGPQGRELDAFIPRAEARGFYRRPARAGPFVSQRQACLTETASVRRGG